MTFEELFALWKTQHCVRAFISDGIVDEDAYESPHVLFVLRDMNCGVETDLRRHLREHGSGWKTWNNVGRWTCALLDGEAEYPRDMKRDTRAALLRRVAAINLKKEGGGARANGKDLLAAVESQRDLLLREIEMCSPQIIIACGLGSYGMESSASLLRTHVFAGEPEWKSFRSAKLDRDWWYFYTHINGRKVPVISFCHPQTTSLGGLRGHDLFSVLYGDMLCIRERFLGGKNGI